ncbi:thiamine phosphate synthase [Evansella sp. AB-P1]|uniref:thiamine phosphate synthase n=1 Tax=Evansella sp. AB-P1 TaxID=3037653 RepID=UPI00241E5DC8|nr:thiamine phosphate synthase [Evansella sp. AB-P1]MDG5786049.1 thiamine phosphate synthase [Evansella sp. AB-P1]
MARVSAQAIRNMLKVYFIAGSTNVTISLPSVLQQAIDGGITLFQYREKGSSAFVGIEKEQLGLELITICKNNGIPFIMNDDVELALKLDADGVHIGQEDGNVEEIRKKIGDRILGVSAHNFEEAKAALEAGADYLGVGPVFPTTSKTDTSEVCGPQFIAELRELGIEAPIVAIGGISINNASEVVAGKADGLSVISAISSAEAPAIAAKELNKAWE